MSAMRSIEPNPYPRLGHVQRHVRRDLWPILEMLLEPVTVDEMAERFGPGYTRRYVEPKMAAITAVLPLNPKVSYLFRLALLRVVIGLDPCWCER